MSLAKLFVLSSQAISSPGDKLNDEERELISLAMWASEPIPFDPMEVALHNTYAQMMLQDERPHYKMVHEYPIGGNPPMMTHIFENDLGSRIIAAKGAPEGVTFKTSYDRSTLIREAIESVKGTLTEEIIAVSLVVLIFLFHWRSAAIILIQLPISVAAGFIFLEMFGISSNIMSLTGIALAIGVVVDDGIVMVENAYRHISVAQMDKSQTPGKS